LCGLEESARSLCLTTLVFGSFGGHSHRRGCLQAIALFFLTPNAAPQPLPKAGAERTLEAVGCRRLLDVDLASATREAFASTPIFPPLD
jgi:hypothetical protein